MWRGRSQWTLGMFLAMALLGAARADLGIWGPTPGFVQADQQFLDFGNVVVGSLSSPRTLTFQNYGAATVTVQSLQLMATDGSTDTPFRMVPVGTTCVPATNLLTVQTCTVSVAVAPLALGKFQGSLYMNLYIVLTGAFFQSNPVLLQVNAVPPAPVPSPVPSPSPSPLYATSLAGFRRHPSERITANPTALEFGDVIVGSSSSKKAITFTNAGTDSVEVAAIMLSAVDVPPAGAGFVLGVVDGSQASQDPGFTLAGGTCTPGMSVAPGASCTVNVKAAPTALGSISAQVYLSVNTAVAVASSDKVLLHATAVAQPIPSPIARKSLRR